MNDDTIAATKPKTQAFLELRSISVFRE